MNRNLFTPKSPGKLREIRIFNQEDWAFVPDDPPSRMKMPERIWKLLTLAQSELARLDGVAMHIPNYELLLKPLQAREALKSSSLEGTYATPEELLLFEVGPLKKNQNDQINMPKEISNYRKSLRKREQLARILSKCYLSPVKGRH